MRHVIGIEWGLLALVIVLPLVAWRVRRRPGTEVALWLAAATYVVVLLSLTFLPVPLGRERVEGPLGYPWFNLQPFTTISRSLRLGPGSHTFLVLVGNLFAFMPVGMLLPLLRPLRHPWLTVLVAAAGLSVAIELGQLAASLAIGVPYRQADIDDVIVNTASGVLGYAILVMLRGPRSGSDSAKLPQRE